MKTAQFTEQIESARQQLQTDPKALVELKPMPAVALKVTQACKDDNFKLTDLAKLVESDAVFASKMLSFVNSAVYCHMREISTIHQSLVVLGRKNIVQMAMSIAAGKVFMSVGEAADLKKSIFEHSLACGAVASALAKQKIFEVDAGAAFLAGILHDVGKLVMVDLAPEAYSQCVVQEQPEVSSVVKERELFGTDHASLGILFGETWELAPTMQSAIAHHHDELSSDESDSMTGVIQLANQLAATWGLGQAEPEQALGVAERWLNDTDEQTIESTRAFATGQYDETNALLAR
jgi:putative nucleotidyltransferase with HDIG domain